VPDGTSQVLVGAGPGNTSRAICEVGGNEPAQERVIERNHPTQIGPVARGTRGDCGDQVCAVSKRYRISRHCQPDLREAISVMLAGETDDVQNRHDNHQQAHDDRGDTPG
jgi:hypothetical protein